LQVSEGIDIIEDVIENFQAPNFRERVNGRRLKKQELDVKPNGTDEYLETKGRPIILCIKNKIDKVRF